MDSTGTDKMRVLEWKGYQYFKKLYSIDFGRIILKKLEQRIMQVVRVLWLSVARFCICQINIQVHPSVALLGDVGDIIRHLRKSIQLSVDDANLDAMASNGTEVLEKQWTSAWWSYH